MEEVTLQHNLAQLVDAELLYQRGQPPQATYSFKHALVQDAAYQSLLRSTRQQYHQRIVQVLESQFPETVETQPKLLTHHTLSGEVWDKALTYWQRAGEKALARSAYREGVGYFEQGISVLPHLPETRDTQEQAIDLRFALRTALLPSGNSERILAHLREAQILATALDDPRRLGRISRFLSVQFSLMGAHDQAIADARRALVLATTSGEVGEQVLANERPGQGYYAQGDYRQAIACYGQAVASLDEAQHRERFGQVMLPAVNSRAHLAACHAELGTFAEGRILGEEGLRIASAVNHPASLMRASLGIGLLFLRQGDLSRALSWLEQAVRISHEADLSLYFPQIAPALGVAYALSGRVADAIPLLTQAIEQTTATGMVFCRTLCHHSLGEVQLLAGRFEDAQPSLSGR